MSSILTNNSAMVALQTLKQINMNLAQTQNEISTGKSVANSSDNSAVWAISKVMESDVKGFKSISDSLSLGQSTVAVARNAAETVTDLLTDIKGKIVAAQEENVDRSKIQDDIRALTDQIRSVVGAAQFNGLNLVNGSQTGFNTDGNVGINVLSSLDRDSSGGVLAANIGVDAQNLSTNAGDALTGASMSTPVTSLDQSGGATDAFTIDTFAFLDTSGGATGTSVLKASSAGVDTAVTTGLVEGDTLRLKVGTVEGTYVVRAGDDDTAIVAGLKNGLLAAGIDENKFSVDITTTAGDLTVTNLTNESAIAVDFNVTRGTGALAQLDTFDVSTDAGAATALGSIESMIQSSIDAAASFGSVEGRIETQSTFISNLTDSLRSGIGALVDADMEEVSARLQALQTQQQLGVQSLSIANQAPQTILSLFR